MESGLDHLLVGSHTLPASTSGSLRQIDKPPPYRGKDRSLEGMTYSRAHSWSLVWMEREPVLFTTIRETSSGLSVQPWRPGQNLQLVMQIERSVL